MWNTLSLLLSIPPWAWQPVEEPTEEEPEVGPTDTPGAFLYEEGVIHDFQIEMTPEAMDALDRNGPDVHARLTYGGVSWDVGLKLKGSSTYQNLDGKPSIKIDMEQWVPDQSLLGVRRLTLNSMIFDPTMLREHASYRLHEAAGVAASRHGWARVSINGVPYGLYGIVETLDEQWLRRMFPGDSEGNLYDSKFTSADLSGGAVDNFELKEGDPLTAHADLYALVDAIDGGDIMGVLDTRFDRESVLGMWAVDLVSGNWDGYSRNTNNYLLYHATVADRWYFVPWGQDTAFRGGGSLYMGVRGRLVTACLGDGACKEALEARVLDVLDAWRAIDLVGYIRAASADIAAACAADPRKSKDCDPEDILERLTDRPDEVAPDLPSAE